MADVVSFYFSFYIFLLDFFCFYLYIYFLNSYIKISRKCDIFYKKVKLVQVKLRNPHVIQKNIDILRLLCKSLDLESKLLARSEG